MALKFLNNGYFAGKVGIGTTSPDYLLDLYKSTSTTETTLQRLWNYVGSDLNQQKTFIDFVFQDDNDNEYPQVRIGAEVGQNGNASSQIKEGSGAFVVYTNNATGDGPGAPTDLAERFRVDYKGNVGIGTTNPGAKLQLGDYPSNNIDITTYPNVPSEHMIHITAPETTNRYGGGISFGENAFTAANITVQDAGGNGSLHMLFGTRNTSGTVVERMRVTSGGDVGIGTDSPDSKLEVAGGTTGIILSNLGNSSAYDAVAMTYSGYNSGTPEFIFQPKTNPGSGTVNSYFRFKNRTSGGTNISNVTVDGKIGLGTDSPGSKLSIDSVPQDALSINSSDGDGPYAVWRRQNGTLGFVGNANALSVSGNTNFGVRATNDLVFAAGGATERMRINSSGEVLVGVTSNQTESKLTSRQNGSSIEFGHLNQSSGYYGTLGAMYSSGRPFLAFSCDSSPTSAGNNFATRGFKGNVIFSETNGTLKFAQATNANSTSQALTDRMAIKNDGAVQFNAYDSTNNTGTPTYLLGTDASGNVVKTTTVPGSGAGPYLPLSAGPSYPLTGDLYQTMGAIGVAQTDQDYIAKIYELNSDGFLSLYTGQPTPLEKVRISSYGDSFFVPANNGKIGIGTTSPIGLLEVSKDSTTDGLSQAITVSSSSVTTKRMNIGYVPGSNYAFIDVLNYGISNTNQALSLQPNGGKVGIGTTSPNNLLNLSKNVANGDVATYIQNSNADTGSTNETTSLKFAHGNDAVIGYVGAKIVCGKEGDFETSIANIKGNLQFYTAGGTSLDSDVNNIERMRIDSVGTVLIGTTSSGYDTTQGYPLHAMSDLTSQSYISVARKGQTSGTAGLIVGLDTTNAYLLVRDNIPLILGNNNLSHVFIKTTGYVGIGTSTPRSRLQVAGGIQMADDTDTASADKAGTMRYRTGTEYVEVTGTELVTNGDFASSTSWELRNSASINNGTGVATVPGAGALGSTNGNWSLSQASVFAPSTLYKVRFQARRSAGTASEMYVGQSYSLKFNQVLTADWVQYEVVFTSTSNVGWSDLSFGGVVGTTSEVKEVSVVEVTAEDASYADMCMQTGASTYEWVNIVRNTY